jgi:hypothetical protein
MTKLEFRVAHLLSSTTTAEAQYLFRGENVMYEQPPTAGALGGRATEMISGSSVAALRLSCCAIDGISVKSTDRRSGVEQLFKRARVPGGGHYVTPWMLFGESERGDGDSMFLRALT